MVQEISLSSPLSISKFFKTIFLLILTASVLILFNLSCSKNPADSNGGKDDKDAIDLDSLAYARNFIPISTYHELSQIGIAKNLPLDTNYMLTSDIDASPSKRLKFEPIGSRTNVFTGEFDGYGHTVKNLYIRLPDNADVGLFGFVDGAKIYRLHVEADSIAGGMNLNIGEVNVGGIVGFAQNSLIDSCSFKGVVKGKHWAGGIAGTAFSTMISRSISKGTVLSVTDNIGSIGGTAGGIAGALENGAIVDRSYSSADVTGGHNTGGLVGHSDRGVISYSYSTGSVSGGVGLTGGLLGSVHYGTVTESYSTGKVSWTPTLQSNAGGLIGRINQSAIVRSYWDITRSLMDESGGRRDTAIVIDTDGAPRDTVISIGEQGRDSTRMLQRDTYTGWDFIDTWVIDEKKSTPYFRWHPSSAP